MRVLGAQPGDTLVVEFEAPGSDSWLLQLRKDDHSPRVTMTGCCGSTERIGKSWACENAPEESGRNSIR